jgi:GH43 family beta-xylosidase
MTLFDEFIYETSVRMFDPGMIVVPYTASGRDGLRYCCRGVLRANKAHEKTHRFDRNHWTSSAQTAQGTCRHRNHQGSMRALFVLGDDIPNTSFAPSTRWNTQAAGLPLKSSPDYWVADGQTQDG